MNDQLDVRLHDTFVATIVNVTGDLNVLTLDEAYRNDPDAPVVSFKAFRHPVTNEYLADIRPTRTRLHPYCANLLPEGPLRAYLAEHAKVNPVRDFPLLWLLGSDLPGALIVSDHDGRPNLLEKNATSATDATSNGKVLRFSLAGVQLKFSATGMPDCGLTIPVSGLGGTWIVKLPDQRFNRVSENEHSMMTFAKAVGIDVPEIGLVEPEEILGMPSDIRNLSGTAYYIKRFDRTLAGGRIHTEDFAQANNFYPADKYRRMSFDNIAAQIADIAGVESGLEFVRRLVFNLGIGNGDMHPKNWSVVYLDRRTPSLAPAYDYLSTVVYLPEDNTGLNLGGTKAFTEVDDDRLMVLAEHARLPRVPVLKVAHDVVDQMRETWPQIQASLTMEPAHRALVTAHMDRVPLFQPKMPGSRARTFVRATRNSD
jgi:serine/threonine-protein kinase HipA